jgi:16S rRNA (guanine527-N7)-methyltransferase
VPLTPVSRETLQAIADRWALPTDAPAQIAQLLEALAAEPDPHTTVSEPARALDIHISDSLAALDLPAVRNARSVVDIGAGAGFPGLPLAIALPGAHVDLVEAASRKTAVIARLAAAAGIVNARSIHARAEEWADGEGARRYDLATARAVAPLAVLVEYAAPLLSVGGVFVAWKGTPAPDEVVAGEAAASQLGLDALGPVPVTPYEGAHGLNLYVYSKVRDTPAKFPRRPGTAAKRPLVAKNDEQQPLT